MLRRFFLTFRTSSRKKIQSKLFVQRDGYNALHLTPTQTLENQQFQEYITKVVDQNSNDSTSSIWLHLKNNNLNLMDSLVNISGFKIHRGKGNEVSLYRWMRKQKVDLVPPYSMCIISCGGVIIHNNKILLVREKAGSLKGHYGIPGGRADMGQVIQNCVERQIWQQVGLKGKFKQILWCRELSGYVYGSSDMYFACLIEVGEQQLPKLKICQEEVQLIQWVHLSQLSTFMSTRSVGTQKKLGVYLQKLYKEGYDFKRQSNYKWELYTSPIDGKQRFFGQHCLAQEK